MPELPEVEVTRCGIEPHIARQTIKQIIIRQPHLRWPIPPQLPTWMAGQRIVSVKRRAKYLLLKTEQGTAIIHLGMSGSLQLVKASVPPKAHDHVDMVFTNGKALRFNDPRRFGALLWTAEPVEQYPLLAKLGPEPLEEDFTGEWLYHLVKKRTIAVKTLIMDSKVVVGIGNIYANEALFAAGIKPNRAVGTIALCRYIKLVAAIKQILHQAIKHGGTTLNDFVGSDGKPGYFKQALKVYGRAGDPCIQCQRPLTMTRLAQRSTVFCRYCQR